MKIFMLSVMSVFLFWPDIGSAELYKWTDDQGNLHITDTPPRVAQKKSVNTASPVPGSAAPKKAAVRPTLPGRIKAEIHSVPNSIVPSQSSEEAPIQQTIEGLGLSQATLTSFWQTFGDDRLNTKVPVQRWKDKQGLDHFADVLPPTPSGSEIAPTLEGVSASHPARSAKQPASGAFRSHHQPDE
ncbi:MAG TPA: DUF4124 domain-containing protein [Nitrospira sp.]|nr:DUF4124 domain-containing protein [Nitrospira sp.]